MIIWAVDPGTVKSAIVRWHVGPSHVWGAIEENAKVERILATSVQPSDYVAIEKITGQGRRAIGRETLEAHRWQTRFEVAAEASRCNLFMISRTKSRTRIAGPYSGDKQVREAVIEYFGGYDIAIGTSEIPGPLRGLADDEWQALAVAVVCRQMLEPTSKRGRR